VTVEQDVARQLLPRLRDEPLSPPLDLRIRLWLTAAGRLGRCGFFPTTETMPSIPLARRSASKPPWWLSRRLPSDVAFTDHPGGPLGPPYSIRAYRGTTSAMPLPIVLFMHGGGFINGGLDSMHYTCGIVASTAGVLVVSVDYPLAPEAPFPAALEATAETLAWLGEHGHRLGGQPDRIAVMGDSAGGNLAAALCLLARRNGGPDIAHQVLIYPALDATLSTPSMGSADAGRRRDCALFYGYYAGKARADNELISPLLAHDLAGLPPATILTADHDALRDDGLIYAQRLERAGVRVRHTNYLGMPHGFLSMPRLCRAAPQALAEVAAAVRS
jgi:acetyl esterase